MDVPDERAKRERKQQSREGMHEETILAETTLMLCSAFFRDRIVCARVKFRSAKQNVTALPSHNRVTATAWQTTHR